MLCIRSSSQTLFDWSAKTQRCQLLCDLRQVTHLTFLSFPSFILKVRTKSTPQSCCGEGKRDHVGEKKIIKCNVLHF